MLACIVAGALMLLGCGSEGGSSIEVRRGPRSSARTFVGTSNTEIVEGLPFLFTDGAVFHAALAGEAVTVTLDTVTNTVITVTLKTADQMAQGEIILDTCDLANVLRDPVCLYPITITASDFVAGTGPQVGEVLMLEDWLLIGSVAQGDDHATVSLTVEDEGGMAVASEPLEVDRARLCPWVCAGS